MSDVLFAAAGAVMLTTGLGLVRMLVGPTVGDRMMAAQLLGVGGGAAALLTAIATGVTAIVDIALLLALLAALAAVALTLGTTAGGDDAGGDPP